MCVDRRGFMQIAAGAASIALLPGRQAVAEEAPLPDAVKNLKNRLEGVSPITDDERKGRIAKAQRLMKENGLGATYADVRFITHRRQDLLTEDERVASINDRRDSGFGVRVLADGAWGFASSSGLSREEVMRAAGEAVAIARASATALRQPVRWAPEPAHQLSFRSPRRIDPF